VNPHLVFFVARFAPRRISLHDERVNFSPSIFAKHDIQIRESAVRDPHLLPVLGRSAFPRRSIPRASANFCASDPACGFAKQYAPINSPVASFGNIFSSLSFQNKRSAAFRCPRARRASLRIRRKSKVFPSAPSSKSCPVPPRRTVSGTPRPSNPTSPPLRTSSAINPAFSCFPDPSRPAGLLLSQNSSAVCPISF